MHYENHTDNNSLGSAEQYSRPIAEGFETATPLPTPTGYHTATQARQMGIQIGDTIVGRAGSTGEWWTEVKLELRWKGDTVAVWRCHRRTSDDTKWYEEGEAANWSLRYRVWFLLPKV